jgi:hypothetical protein
MEMTRYFFDIYNGHLHRDHLDEDRPMTRALGVRRYVFVRDVEDMLAPGGIWRLDVRAGHAPVYRIRVKAEQLRRPRRRARRGQVRSDRAGTGMRRPKKTTLKS